MYMLSYLINSNPNFQDTLFIRKTDQFIVTQKLLFKKYVDHGSTIKFV